MKIITKALLQEIVSVYYAIDPPTLSAMQSNRVCNALALLQCVASHPDTRYIFLISLFKGTNKNWQLQMDRI